MRLSLPFLRASLRTWKLKLAYRQRRHRFFHDESKRPDAERERLARKWHNLAEKAEKMVALRSRQIVSRERANRRAAAKASGVGRFDGVPVALWMVPYLEWARANGWRGRLVSGWRDPQYSRSLCMRMCGAPSCPGRCAGTSSNHVGSRSPNGAIDVSDYQTFGRLMTRCPLRPQLVNRLGARDPVHFSVSGN